MNIILMILEVKLKALFSWQRRDKYQQCYLPDLEMCAACLSGTV